MHRLIHAVQELSLARDLDTIMKVVRKTARELTGADGATFVLRDGEFCYYAEEDAIAPLWKGQRFPLQTCISGWTMLNRQPAVIPDIYADPRIPAAAYRPTFVKSLAMVPIRTADPIGAIGNYWATHHSPTPQELELLQALANTTAVAMENVRVYGELEKRVKDRTLELEVANQELETFSYAVSHDLSAPLRRIRSYAELILKEQNALDPLCREWLGRIQDSSVHMGELIDDLLRLSKFSRTALRLEKVNLSRVAQDVWSPLTAQGPARQVELRVAPCLEATADEGLIRAALENLLSNAWKYTARQPRAVVEFGRQMKAENPLTYYVRDNGAGFDMRFADKLFQPFQRLHGGEEFPGNGIGLVTVRRIIERHGGRIWAESVPGEGATFFFTLAC